MSTAASPIRLLLADVDGTFLSARYGMAEEEIATIGDMPNDVLMFARSGLAIAMGPSGAEAHRAARRVTTSNEEDGFANAVDRFILRASQENPTFEAGNEMATDTAARKGANHGH